MTPSEEIDIDGEPMRFAVALCPCAHHLVALDIEWGPCGECGYVPVLLSELLRLSRA